MIHKLILLCLVVTNVLGAPTIVPPAVKQQPTVITIVSQFEELIPNGTYTYSFETGNGIKREETSYDKIIPKSASRSAGSDEGENSDEDYDSNEIHVQRGSYSYTAPDGTLITLSYIADENGFQPIGNHLPQPPAPVSPTLNLKLSKPKSAPQALDNSGSDSVHLPVIGSLKSIPVIAARLADKGILSESTTPKDSETATVSKNSVSSATTIADIAEENSVNTESAASSDSESENNSDKSVQGNDVSKPEDISTISPFQPEAISEDSSTTLLSSTEGVGSDVSTSLPSAESSTTVSADTENSESTDKQDVDTPSNALLGIKQVDSQSGPTTQESLTETVSDTEVSTTSKSVNLSGSSEEKTTELPGEETTLAIAVADDKMEDYKDVVSMEEVTENVVASSTLTDYDVTNDGTESSNKEVSTLATSA